MYYFNKSILNFYNKNMKIFFGFWVTLDSAQVYFLTQGSLLTIKSLKGWLYAVLEIRLVLDIYKESALFVLLYHLSPVFWY